MSSGPDLQLGGKAAERRALFLDARGLAEPGVDDAVSAADTAVRAWSEALRDDVVSAVGSPVWRSLGPSVIRHGQTAASYNPATVDVAGRVSAIAIDPADGAHILLGAGGGGVWETRDRGVTWTPRGDQLATLAVGALCFDPNPSPAGTSIAYLGTGECGGTGYESLGQGVYRSTDGGRTWALRAAEPFVGKGFFALVVDPADSDTLYAATDYGVFVSRDAAATWRNARVARCWSVSVDPHDGAAEVLAACGDGVFRSTDRGDTWSRIPVTDDASRDSASFLRIAVTHSAAAAGGAWIWAGVSGGVDPITGGRGGIAWLWRRFAGDDEFVQVEVPPDLTNQGQVGYNWHAHAAPHVSNVVFVGARDLYRVDWRKGSAVWTNVSNASGPEGFVGDSIHSDQHAMAFDPVDGDVMYAGCDGGVYRSPNRGTTWHDLNDGLTITEIEYLAQDAGSANWLLAGTQDNGTIRYTGQREWEHVADGDGGDCAVSAADPETVYHSFFYMGVERSADRGDTWLPALSVERDPSRYSQLFYPPMESAGPVVAQAGETVFVSRDEGNTFSEVILPAWMTASALCLPDPDRIYMGSTSGRMALTTWTGSDWSAAVELPMPPGLEPISDIAVDPAPSRRIWVTSTFVRGPHVLRSDDAGLTWVDVSAALPALPVNAIEVNPDDRNQVWVALDKGVFRSLDAGESWTGMSAGLPNCIVADLLYHRQSGRLRAGTRSRGVWECDIAYPTPPTSGVRWWGRLDPGGSATFTEPGWPASWHVQWTVQPASLGARLSCEVEVERASSEHVTYRVTVHNRGETPARAEGRYVVLSRG